MKYLCLLRGVNVGGNNKVSMAELRSCFEAAGFANVQTYINSGNVIFESAESDLVVLNDTCERCIEERFGFSVRTLVLSVDGLSRMFAHAPSWWGGDAASKHNAIFVMPPTSVVDVQASVGEAKPKYEQVAVYENLIFWSAPIATFGRTRWMNIIGSALYKEVTIRNSNTVQKLLTMMQQK